MKINKRFVSMLLAVLMVLQVMPLNVLAQSGGAVVVSSNVLKGAAYHKVEFVNDDGSLLAEQYVLSGNTPVMPEAPSKAAHRFVGWFSGDTQVTAATPVTAGMTVAARFVPIASYTFTVLYQNVNGDEVANPVVRSYTEDDDLPVNEQGVKYVTITSPETVVEADDYLFPRQTEVTFLLNGESVQTQIVVYEAANVTYTVEHYSMSRTEGPDGSVTYSREGAKLLADYTQTMSGLVGARIDPKPLTLEHYIYMERDSVQLTADGPNVAHVFYRAERYPLNYNSMGGSYIAPVYVAYGESVQVYTYTEGGEVICGLEAHEHNFSDCGWNRGWACGKVEHTHGESCLSADVYTPAPTRAGYVFAGWYADEACTVPAAETMVLTGAATVYAKWEPSYARYTIVYEKQVYNNAIGAAEWVYSSSSTGEGIVGQMTNAGAGRSPSDYHELEGISNVEIKADGSSVAIVRYRLKTYTIIFDLNDSNNATGTIAMNGQEYHGTAYQLQVVLGQDISSMWPTPDKVSRSNGQKLDNWVNGRTNYKTARFEVTEDMLPSNGTSITYNATWFSVDTQKIVQYWLQDVNGAYYAVDYTYSQVFISDNDLNPKELYGFENVSHPGGTDATGAAYPESGRARPFVFKGETYTDIYVYNFYYKRSQYTIDYRYHDVTLGSKTGVYFGKDISGAEYNFTPDPTSVGLAADYTFAGWFDNAECAGEPYNFTVMPGNNLLLYAKFAPPMRTVTLNPQNGDPSTDIHVPVGSTIDSLPVLERDGYIFIGWFTESVGGNKFDLAQPITEHMHIYAQWQRIQLEYTVQYLDAQGNPLAPEKVVTSADFLAGQTVQERALTIRGYRVRTNRESLVLTTNNSANVITFYYDEQMATTYTVRYLIDGTDISVLPDVSKPAGTEVERVTEFAPTDVVFEGKTYYPLIEVLSLDLVSDASQNVLTFTYLPYKTAQVEVTFWYDGVQDASLTKTVTLRVGDSVNAGQYKTDAAYTRDGLYKFQKAEPENLTVVADMDGQKQTMAIYYVINEAAYTINHYLYGTEIAIAPGTLAKAIIGTTVQVNAKSGTGEYANAIFDSFGGTAAVTVSGSSATMTIDRNAANNVVNVYYKLPVTVQANTATYTYDGTPKTVAGSDGLEYTVTGALSTDVITGIDVVYTDDATTTEDRTNAGSYTAKVASTGNFPAYYIVSTGNGTLTINKAKVEQTLTATGFEGVYDGEDHYVTVSGTIDGDVLRYRVHTLAGPSAWTENSPYMMDVDTVKPVMEVEVLAWNPNYETRTARAELHILPRPLTVYNEETFTYNGQEQHIFISADHAQSGAGVGLVPGETLHLTGADITGTNVGVYTQINEDGYTCLVRKPDGLNTSTHNYDITVSGKMTITRRDVTFEGQTDSHYYHAGREHVLTGITTSGLIAGHTYQGVTYEARGADVGEYPGKFTQADHFALLDQSGADVTDNYNIIWKPGVLTVLVSETPLHVDLNSMDVYYDGTVHYLQPATANDPVDTTIVYSADNTNWYAAVDFNEQLGQLDAGVKTIWVRATNPNYPDQTATDTATITVRPRKVTLTSATASKTYDGKALTAPTVTASERGFVDGEGVTCTGFPSLLTAGRIDNEFTYTVNPGTKESNYEITQVYGYLMIAAIQSAMTVKADSAEKVYDGTPLTRDSYTVIDSTLLEGDRLVVTIEGSQTNVGQGLNMPTKVQVFHTMEDGSEIEVTSSYRFNQSQVGRLIVTARDVTFTGETASLTYNGSRQAIRGVTAEGLVDGHTWSRLRYVAAGTDVGVYDGEFSNETLITDASGNDVTDNYNITLVPGKLTITTAQVEQPLTASGYRGTYNGVAHGVTVRGAVTGDVIYYSLTGGESATDWTTTAPTRTDVQGAETIYIKAENHNYNTRYTSAQIEILPITLTVYGEATFAYDGQAHTITLNDTHLMSNNMVAGETLTLHAAWAQTDVGVHSHTFTAADDFTWSVAKADGSVSTGNYVVNASAKITITVRDVTFTGETATRTYNGEVQTITGVTQNGLVEGHRLTGATYAASGRDVVGSPYQGAFTGEAVILDANGQDVTANYSITLVPGTLTIVASTETIVITAASDTKMYDGTALTNAGYTFTEGVVCNGDVLTATVSGSQTDAGESANVVTGWKVMHGDVDVTANYTFGKPVNGTLTVTRRTVLLTSETASKVYDGTPLYARTVAVTGDGFVGNEGASFNVVGVQLDAGTSSNRFTYTLTGGAKADNYDITTQFGTLTVTPITTEIIITANSAEKMYDGTALTDSGFTYSPDVLVTGDVLTAVVEGTQTDAGSSANVVVSYKVMNGHWDVTDNYTFGEHVDGKLTVTKRSVVLTSATDSKVYDGTALTNDEVTVTGDGFAPNEGAAYTVTGSQLDVGTSENKFTYALNDGTKADNYVIEVKFGTLTVTPITKEIIITANSAEKMYDGTVLHAYGYTYTDGVLAPGDELTARVSGGQTDVGTSANKISGYIVTRGTQDVTANYTFGEPVDGTLTVTKRSVVLTSATDNKVYDGTALTNDEITVTGDGFAPNEGAAYTVTGTQLDVGSSENKFTYALNGNTKADNYVIEVKFGTLTVTPINKEIIITANSAEKMYDGTALVDAGYTYTENVLVTGDILTAVVEGAQTDAGESANVVVSYKVTRGETDVTANYTFGEHVDGTLTVTQRSVVLTSATDSKVYDGTALTNDEITVTGDGFAPNEGAAYTVTGTQLDVGTSDNAFTYVLNGNTKAANYTIEVKFGTLTVTPITTEIIITANSAEKMYDGTALVDAGYTFTENVLVTGDILTAVVEGSQTDAGSSANVVVSYKVTRGETDVTANYTFGEHVDGTLTVTKRSVVLTSATDSKVYDGTALTNDEVTVTGDGFAPNEGAAYTVTGTQLDVGTSDNAFTYALNGNTKADNYVIEVKFGTLMVTPITKEIIITANSAEKMYDGTALVDAGYTFTENVLVTGDILTAVVEGSQTDAGESANVVTGWKVTRTSDGKDVTGNYTFGEPVDGTLTVTQRSVTLTSATDSKVYDGTVLTNDEVTVTGDGFAPNEGAAYTVTGTQLDVGTSDNAFTYALNGNTKADNYVIEVKFGTLTVTPITKEIIITANSAEKMYDGTALVDAGYTFTENVLVTGDILTAVVEGTQTDAGESANVVTGWKVTRTSDGKDVTGNYTFGEPVDGTLTVTQREITLTSDSATKEYDAAPLTAKNVTLTGDGFAEGEGATYDVTGSQTYVGSSENTFTYALNEGTKAANYIITVIFGQLTVTGPSLIPEKTTPDVESNYELGDAIPFTIAVQNVRDQVIENVIVVDQNAVILPGAGYTVSDDGHTATIPVMQIGETVLIAAEHIVTEEDILAGTVGNVATVTWGDESFFPETETDMIDEVDGTMKVLKTSDVPEGVKAELNQIITYTIVVENLGNVTFHNVVVKDELAGVEIQPGEGYTVNADGTATIKALGVGATVAITATYTVTEADLLRGYIRNLAVAQGDPIPDPDTPDIPVVPGEEDEEETDVEDVDTTMTLVKTALGVRVGDGYIVKDFYNIGDVVFYSIDVTNLGNVTYYDVRVTDEYTGLDETIDVLPIGETVSFITGMVVTVDHVLDGVVYNLAVASGRTEPGEVDPEQPYAQDDESVLPEAPCTDLEVIKEILGVSTGEGYWKKRAYELYDEVHYLITVTNTGNVPFRNIRVVDERTGLDVVIPTLDVGETVAFETVYTVNVGHIMAGYIYNEVTASGEVDHDPEPGQPQPEPPFGKDDAEAPTVPDDYTVPLGRMVMNVGDCFE